MPKLSFRKKMSTKRQITGRISQRQFKIMVDFMEKNIDITYGKDDLISPKCQLKKKWEALADTLNAFSAVNNLGCQKTPDQWRKCWSDKKNGVRNKIRMRNPCSECSKEQGLNQLERRILNLFPAYASKELEDKEDWTNYEFCQCPKNNRSTSPDSEEQVLSQPVTDSDGVLFCPVVETQESCSSPSKDQLFLEQQQLNDLLMQADPKDNQITLYSAPENTSMSNIASFSTTEQQLKSMTNLENIIVLNDVSLAPAVVSRKEPVSSSFGIKEPANYNSSPFLFSSDPNKMLNSSNSVSLLRENINPSKKSAECEKVSKMDNVFHASLMDEIKKHKNIPISLQNKDDVEGKSVNMIELSNNTESLIKTGSESKIFLITSVLNQDNFNDIQDSEKVKNLSALDDSSILYPVLQETEISSNSSLSDIPVSKHLESFREFEISPNSNFDNIIIINSVPRKIEVPNNTFISKLQSIKDADDTVVSDIEDSSTQVSEEMMSCYHASLVSEVLNTKSVGNKALNDDDFESGFEEITSSNKATALEQDSPKKMLLKDATKLQREDKKRKLNTEEETDSIKNLIENQNKMLAIIAEASQKRAEEATRQTEILMQLVQEVKNLSQSVTKPNA